MGCASCGKQVAAGVRYCVHCGAEQAIPTPIAAVAAASMSMGRARRGEAANAAHAEPALRDSPRLSGASGNARAGPRIDDQPSPLTTPMPGARVPNSPAYAAGPRRRGLAVALIGACAVVALAALAVIGGRLQRAHGDTVGASDMNATSARSAPAGPAIAAPAMDKPALPAPQPSSSSVAAGDATPPQSPALPSSSDTAQGGAGVPRDAPVEIKPLPPRVVAHAARRAPITNEATPAPPVEHPAHAPVPTPPPNRVTAAAPAGVPVVDRWRRMDDELSRCTREDFITRVVCGQRVRFRYCAGYWGKVPACPGNPAPEQGQ